MDLKNATSAASEITKGICPGFIWLKKNAKFITSLLEGDSKNTFLEVLFFTGTS